uniref:glycosyltransferase n=1 Tax=Treponema sp. TaxID=166 RepID=UPI002580B925
MAFTLTQMDEKRNGEGVGGYGGGESDLFYKTEFKELNLISDIMQINLISDIMQIFEYIHQICYTKEMKERKKPFLSVITINRNNAEGLKRTVESVVSQQNVNFKTEVEYIIIDGNSTDKSVFYIEQLEKKFKNTVSSWISEPDTGIYNAMNKGIQKATGQYLHFLNSGDFYE